MTSIQLLRTRYDELHGRIYRAVTVGLSESEFRVRALPELNPVAWMLWHVGRAEDVAINRLVTDGEQVLDRECLQAATRRRGHWRFQASRRKP